MRTRRQRLESILKPLIRLDGFSADEAKRRCSEVTPSYVTRTLGQLVRDGVLCRSRVRRQTRYRWSTQPPSTRLIDDWIDRQVCPRRTCAPPVQSIGSGLWTERATDKTLYEVMAALIDDGIQAESVNTAALRLAIRFGDRLPSLPECPWTEIQEISPLVTQVGYNRLMAGIELGRRIAQATLEARRERTAITSTSEAIHYCQIRYSRLAHESVQEEFHVVTLDTKHRPLNETRVTVGTLDASLVHPREVFRPAIRDAAAAVLLVHNHPSGDPTPSREDHRVTRQLTDAGKVLGIQVLDHIVVARDGCISIRESE